MGDTKIEIDDAFIAEAIHEFNRWLQCKAGEEVSPPFAEITPANLARLYQLVRGYRNGISPPDAHELWCREMAAAGFVWGPRKDPGAVPPTHPNLVRWRDLDWFQRLKDQMSWSITAGLVIYRVEP